MDAAAMNAFAAELELATWKLLCMRFRLLKRLAPTATHSLSCDGDCRDDLHNAGVLLGRKLPVVSLRLERARRSHARSPEDADAVRGVLRGLRADQWQPLLLGELPEGILEPPRSGLRSTKAYERKQETSR